MKKFIYILSVLLLMNSLQSCEDFLLEQPESSLVTSNFYQSEADAIAAVNAVYNGLFAVYRRNFCLLVDLISDDMKNGIGMSNAQLQDIEYLRIPSNNSFVSYIWQYSYIAIANANTAINNVGNATASEDIISRLIGEAKFLRALNYFNLIRLWGDVPLLTSLESIDDAYTLRTPESEVYNQIVQDLTDAISVLPYSYDASDIGRATKGAASILLGKVYLYGEEWQKSADILSEVIDNESTYGYGLNENYSDNWAVATENGIETVFSVQFSKSPGSVNYLMAGAAPKYSMNGGNGLPGLYVAWEADIPTVELYNTFDDLDERKATTLATDYVSPSDGATYTSSIPLFFKYWDSSTTNCANSDVNFHILRYSDALLMYAEALNELGNTSGAETYINRVRERAFNDATHNYSGLSQSEFTDAIRLERRLEFACEGQRYFDLVRWGTFVSTMQAHGATEATLAGESIKGDITDNAAEKFNLYPIPQHEIDLNSSLEQNSGY